jgi:hypothetical protein
MDREGPVRSAMYRLPLRPTDRPLPRASPSSHGSSSLLTMTESRKNAMDTDHVVVCLVATAQKQYVSHCCHASFFFCFRFGNNESTRLQRKLYGPAGSCQSHSYYQEFRCSLEGQRIQHGSPGKTPQLQECKLKNLKLVYVQFPHEFQHAYLIQDQATFSLVRLTLPAAACLWNVIP